MDNLENPNLVQICTPVVAHTDDGTPIDEATARLINGSTSDLGGCAIFSELEAMGLRG